MILSSMTKQHLRTLAPSEVKQSHIQLIPFFVRGKAKRNTEKFATEQGVSTITVETLYDAKAHYSR